jgi:hypothetical integral membrane protein (TIGR02206 family)
VESDFRLFGPAHLAILTAIPASAALLARRARQAGAFARRARRAAAVFLAANELLWYGYKLATEGWRAPEGLPLQLCDLALWMTVASAFSLNRRCFEIAYYAGLGGSGMALVTPELWAPALSYPTAYYFLAHGGVVATVLFLVWAGLARPGPGSMWRVFLLLNAYALAIAIFNAAFGTNYLFLSAKPKAPTLLDYLGPWPVYLAGGEGCAFLLMLLLAWPFRAAGFTRVRKPGH